MTISKPIGSLWEMLNLNASAFYKAVSSLRYAQSAVEVLHQNLGDGPIQVKEKMDGKSAESTIRLLNDLQKSLMVLNSKVTSISVDRLLNNLNKGTVTYSDFAGSMKEIDSRLKDELSLTRVFVLESDEESFFDPKEPLFGQAVADQFSSAAFEIDEAGKCLALGRSTACVFHLMRILEIGISAIARGLQIEDPIKPAAKNWGSMLKLIKEKIDTNRSGYVKDRADFFDESHASLDAVKNVWRNSTMHVEKKYTPEEAEHIFGAVRGFMKKLASGLDEQGMFQI